MDLHQIDYYWVAKEQALLEKLNTAIQQQLKIALQGKSFCTHISPHSGCIPMSS